MSKYFFECLLTKAQLLEVYNQLDTSERTVPKKGQMVILSGANGVVTYITAKKPINAEAQHQKTIYLYQLERM